jgi:hypothetical protein
MHCPNNSLCNPVRPPSHRTHVAADVGNSSGGMSHGGTGTGPWIMADLEKGLWSSNLSRSTQTPIQSQYLTAMIKGDSGNHWAIKGGNAAEGGLLSLYDGPRPAGYHPMRKQGAIILGIGGDNSPGATGTFFEGAIVKGISTDAVDDAVQANIVAAQYGKGSSRE